MCKFAPRRMLQCIASLIFWKGTLQALPSLYSSCFCCLFSAPCKLHTQHSYCDSGLVFGVVIILAFLQLHRVSQSISDTCVQIDSWDKQPPTIFSCKCLSISIIPFIKSILISAIRRVLGKYSSVSLSSVPPNIKKTGYGSVQLKKTAILFDLLDEIDSAHIVEAENPTPMEYLYQMFGFLVYISEYASKTGGSKLDIPKVHDRAQVFISCSSKVDGGQVSYVGTIERWSNQGIDLPNAKCVSNTSLFILVENMGRVNYGPYLFDRKGILSSVYVDGRVLKRWKMISIPFPNLNEVPKFNAVIQVASEFPEVSARKKLEHMSEDVFEGPSFYTGRFFIDSTEVADTYISLRGWGKGIAFVNEFNIGRYWPASGPQCNLYIPAPILRRGENVLVIFELESPNPELMVDSVDQPDFTCGPRQASVHQL